MGKSAEDETLLQLSNLLGTDPLSHNVITLVRDQNPKSFKEKLTQVFLSLNFIEAQKVYKIFESMPEVKEAWINALESKMEKAESELKNAEANKELLNSLDNELNELLKKHTESDDEKEEMFIVMKAILKKEIESGTIANDDPSELESELINNNQEIMALIRAQLKKRKISF
jgi:hypothetical protein